MQRPLGIIAGVDPKSIVCEYFRHGRCTKGFKCKFAHDLNVERKGGKIDLFTERQDTLICVPWVALPVPQGSQTQCFGREAGASLLEELLTGPVVAGEMSRKRGWRTGTRTSWKTW